MPSLNALVPSTAHRLDLLQIEGTFRVAVVARQLEAAGRDVIHLEFGEPDFSPPPHVIEAAVRALRNGQFKYAPPPGIPALREAIAATARARGVSAAANEVIVTSGAKPMLQYAALALVDEGDEVLVPDPGFPIYPSLVRLAGGVPRSYPIVPDGDGYVLDVDALEAAVTPRTRVLMINTPHNPTGWVATAEELWAMADLALEHNLWVVTDEIYDGITYGTAQAPSIVTLPGMKNRTVIVDGFSKRYAMTGFRLGFGIIPAPLEEQVTALLINSTSCAPHFVQQAGLAALEGPQDCVAAFRETFRGRRDTFIGSLNTIPDVSAPAPAGAFYAFADIRAALAPTGRTARAFADAFLQDFGVAALPGTDFGSAGEGFLRFSFAASPSDLQRASERLRESVASLGGSRAARGAGDSAVNRQEPD